jgi:hypothetical protein
MKNRDKRARSGKLNAREAASFVREKAVWQKNFSFLPNDP